jgi:NDP-sugar pyrophosphorylase family protein
MKAMVLAAGLGTRLRPLTLESAKPAIPLLGEPLLIRLIRRLRTQGVDAFRVNLHHLPHTIESLFRTAPGDTMPVSFSYEPSILGTAGGLKANESFFDTGTFLMVNGDIVADFPIKEALEFHKQREALATMLLLRQDPPYEHVPVRIDRVGRLRDFKGACPGGNLLPEAYIFTGVHILEPEIFRFIPPDEFYEINDQVYPKAMQNGEAVYGFPVTGYWNDLGQPRRYLDAQRALMERVGVRPFRCIAPTADIAPSTRLGEFVSIGSRCTLEADTSVEDAILWDDVRIKSSASLQGCIVGSGVTVTGENRNRIITRFGEVAIERG